MTMEELFLPGEKFRGYEIVKSIGQGGLGSVYLARHGALDQMYAIKVLRPKMAKSNPEYVKRFVREAKIAVRVRNPNLVAVHDIGYDKGKGLYYLVMDYVEGCTLRTAIAMGGAMEPGEALRIVSCVAGALSAAEPFGVVHRDVKPENILITEEGKVKLVDLGVAKASGTDSLRTMTKTVFGTPNYISPEQARDSSSVDFRADVYSLGIVLFELLAGRRPYECRSQADIVSILFSPDPVPDVRTCASEVSPKLAMLLRMMCEKDPAKRIASASVLLDAIKRFGLQVNSAPAAAPAESQKPFDYAAYIKTPADDTLSFKTNDAEIQDFVAKMKSKKRKSNILSIVVLIAHILAIAACVLWLVFGS